MTIAGSDTVLSLIKRPADNSHYYYSRLDDEQKRIYTAMLSGIRSFSASVSLPMRPANEIALIFNALTLDNPAVFYTSSFHMASDIYKGKIVVNFDYLYPRKVIKDYADLVKRRLRVFDSVEDKSDAEKELFVHDYCLKNFSYDFSQGENSHSVLGIALRKTAVCEGIAKFVKLALDYLGVRSLIVSGKAKNPSYDGKPENHAWNIVKIGGKTFHLDVTFDLTVKAKMLRYDYFNLSDGDIKKDHIITSCVPKCAESGFDYYSQNGLTAHGWRDFEAIVAGKLKRGDTDVTIRLSDVPQTKDITDKVMRIAQRQYIGIKKAGGSLEMSYNPGQMVFEIIFR